MMIHVVPVNDLRPHVEIGFDCWCAPEIADNPVDHETVVVHNSADEREKFETGERRLS